jgi:hypothetical protein
MASSGFHPNAGRFIFIAALPKSASSLMWLIVSTLQEQSGRANSNRQRGRLPHPQLPLTWDLLDNFPEGGTYKSHAPPTTEGFLRAVGGKYVVLLRHPADFVPALYCHLQAELGGRPAPAHPADALPVEIRQKLAAAWWDDTPPRGAPVPWIVTVAPLPRSIFAPGVLLDAAMDACITDGVLLKAMQWMADWLRYRDQERSIVVTYEDLMGTFEPTIERLCAFIRGEPPTDDILQYLKHVTREVAREGSEKNPSYYPRGWTGSIGIWRSYLSEDNVAAYNKVVRGFLAGYPNASLLASVYPNLLIEDG